MSTDPPFPGAVFIWAKATAEKIPPEVLATFNAEIGVPVYVANGPFKSSGYYHRIVLTDLDAEEATKGD